MNDRAKEIFTQKIVPVIVFFQSNNLGMGMPLGTTGPGAIVLEINDRFETTVIFQLQPVGKAKGNDIVQLLGLIGGQLCIMVKAFLKA